MMTELPVGVAEGITANSSPKDIAEERIPIINPHEIKKSSSKPYELFDNIVGYNDVKKLFNLSLSSERPVHILLVGPPASAKTLFMLECIKLERSYFMLGSQSNKIRYDRLFI